VFLGYKAGIKGFVMLDVHNRDIFVSRNVKFYENVFPYFSNYTHNLDTDNNQQFDVFNYSFEPFNDSSYTGEVYNEHNHVEDERGNVRRSVRYTKAPTYLQNYQYHLSNLIHIENIKNTNKRLIPYLNILIKKIKPLNIINIPWLYHLIKSLKVSMKPS